MKPARSPCAGWTPLELLLAVLASALVSTQAVLVVRAALGVAGDQGDGASGEDPARALLARISLALIGSERATLWPALEGVPSSQVRYALSLGLQDGELVWSEPEEIRLAGTSVEWCASPDTSAERRATWTTCVSPLLAGERINGVDDNGNGLIDETGLTFVLDGDRLSIRLTLRTALEGEGVEQTVESLVCLRN